MHGQNVHISFLLRILCALCLSQEPNVPWCDSSVKTSSSGRQQGMSRRCAGLGARCAFCVCSSTSFIFKATYRVSHEFHLPKWTLKNKKRNWWVESKGCVNKKMNLKRPTMKRRRDSSECCSISYWILEFYRIFQWIEREARWNGTEEERGSIGIQHQKYAKLV